MDGPTLSTDMPSLGRWISDFASEMIQPSVGDEESDDNQEHEAVIRDETVPSAEPLSIEYCYQTLAFRGAEVRSRQFHSALGMGDAGRGGCMWSALAIPLAGLCNDFSYALTRQSVRLLARARLRSWSTGGPHPRTCLTPSRKPGPCDPSMAWSLRWPAL